MLPAMTGQVHGAIQRWRVCTEEELKPEDYEQFRALGSTCLAEGRSAELQQFLLDQENQTLVRSMGPVLLAPLMEEFLLTERSAETCSSITSHLVQVCDPGSLHRHFLQIIEDTHLGAIAETTLALIPHLQEVFLRLGHRKASCLGQTLCALQGQLGRLPVPYTQQQEEADQHGLIRCCSALTVLLRPFLLELRDREEDGAELRAELLNFCLRSLREPLLDAELHRSRKSELWLFAAEIFVRSGAILCAIGEFPSGLVFCGAPRRERGVDGLLSREARACLAYLLFVELLAVDSFPAVFSPGFILQCNMQHIDQLLSSKKESHVLKGLALLENSLKKVEDGSLPGGLMDLRSFHSALQNLRLLLTDCPMKHLRESGLQLLQLYIDKLDAEAKHKFFRCTLQTAGHPGVEGFIIKNIRRQIHLCSEGSPNKWFLGRDLLLLLSLVFTLPGGPETDLLTNMDRIMESLNLLRFVFLRDELRKNALVWEELQRIKDEYVRTLGVCISMSRSYYSSELRALRDEQKLRAKEAKHLDRSGGSARTLVVKHQVSDSPPEVQHQVLQSALVTFDLMNSLIVRIQELSEEPADRRD